MVFEDMTGVMGEYGGAVGEGGEGREGEWLVLLDMGDSFVATVKAGKVGIGMVGNTIRI